jgi:hypothetical protein
MHHIDVNAFDRQLKAPRTDAKKPAKAGFSGA